MSLILLWSSTEHTMSELLGNARNMRLYMHCSSKSLLMSEELREGSELTDNFLALLLCRHEKRNFEIVPICRNSVFNNSILL